jgi:hypothetical protein
MTDNEIIKAFEDKVSLIGSMTSVYLDEKDGLDLYEVMTSILDLVNRQNAEIESLQEKNKINAYCAVRQYKELERLRMTDKKCGTCFYAKPITYGSSKVYVECTNTEHLRVYCSSNRSRYAHIRPRTNPACKNYLERVSKLK